MKTIKFILFLFISANCFGQSISELINKVDGSGLEVMLKEFSGEISTVVNGSTVTIRNSLGVTIFKKPINNLVTKIDLANIKPGLYIITVNNSGKHTSQKLILK